MVNFDFTFKRKKKGVLNLKQLRFFYYEVARSANDHMMVFFDWDDEVEAFLKSRGIKMEVKSRISTVEPLENVVYFTKGKKEDKQEALFRHMRNAFAHYRIVKDGDYIVMEDSNKNLTMSAMIKYDDLEELCSIFFRQADAAMQAINDANSPEV
jgi:hypothetical protein